MIRWRRRGDLSSIVRLVRKELIPLSPHQHPRDRRLTDDIKRRLTRGVTLVVANARGGDPIAFLHLEVQQETLFIDLLAVDAGYQGRHLGSELMRQAEAYGRNHGCTRARLFVDEGNDKGQAFYRRLGYTVKEYWAAYNCYELVKPLNANHPLFTLGVPFEAAWHQSGFVLEAWT
ncbi:N-acetyltransferase [Cohnella sp. REN36]|uniref:GNAT family N-acetyltransferase n=1 Tax=Cohnella sp. REN36 TaxID=2887347 RepID=UPI001D13D512|nr:GNAT family N-acetyltransferase [Cohnella sp. REN36]MCC3374968.1 GNAT family N-acetyltransferase [Cohnella sp. REN36]